MRYIDADALKDRLQTLSYDDWNQGANTTWANAYSEVADIVDDFPTADVREVVRCKDCKHWVYNRCRKFITLDDWRSQDDYCSRAERRE